MKTICGHTAVLGFLLLIPVNVASASVHFIFAGNEQNVENLPLLPESGSSALTVTTSGHLLDPNQSDNNAFSYITPVGLAVNNRNVSPNDRQLVPLTVLDAIDTFQSDSHHGGELIRLEFSSPVRLELVYFTGAGAGERFGLIADGNVIDVKAMFGSDEITKIDLNGMIYFPKTMPIATTYDFIPHSAWALHNGIVDPIPEPTTALIWCGLGLTLLGARRVATVSRRRRLLHT